MDKPPAEAVPLINTTAEAIPLKNTTAEAVPFKNKISTLNIIVILLCFGSGFLIGFYQGCNTKTILSSLGSFGGNSFDVRFVEENLNSLDQENPDLIRYTRIKYFSPPSKQPYTFRNDPAATKSLAANFVLKVLGNQTGGKFIEVGANDGEAEGNTPYLEKYLNWTGVLIECNPDIQPNLMKKHRKAWVASVCLGLKRTPETLNFTMPEGGWTVGTLGKKLFPPSNKPLPVKRYEVQAIPLYTILAALGWHEIDFFSLDIEGLELFVLKTIPFDKIKFKVVVVEVKYYHDERSKEEVKAILTSNGYVFVRYEDKDFYFVHKSLAHKVK